MNSISQQDNPKTLRSRATPRPQARTTASLQRLQKVHSPASVQRYKAAFMQRIADHVRLGYTQWTSGSVTAQRAQALVRKFHQRYGVGLTRHQKAYARSQGKASAVLILWEARPGVLQWALMLTPGDNLAHELEKLEDATTAYGRIVVTGYELVQLPRRGCKQPAWTWRMTGDTSDGWRERVLRSARRGADALSEELKELARTPGFAGCRAQVRKLLQLARAEAGRRLGNTATTVSYPPRIGYVQRLSQTGVPLLTWVRQQRSPAQSDVTTRE